jgi:surfeit locus 1 family protein
VVRTVLRKLQQARLLWPTLAALAGLAVLIGLGTWQMERKRWKEGLIAKIAARVHADPVVLFPPLVESKERGQQVVVELDPNRFRDEYEYKHVLVRGQFHHDKERYLYAPSPQGLGWHVYAPLQLEAGDVVWINRGWVPDARKAPETRAAGQVAGPVEVRGLVRFPAGKGLFTPENDVAHNLWYWPDVAAMTASALPGGPQSAGSVPLVIDADAKPEPPGGLPRGGVTRLDLPNRHLEYALTWYGLAATLVGVYLAFSISRLRAIP